MNHRATPRFWHCERRLPAEVQQRADACYQLLRQNSRHPSLHMKKMGRFWAVRVGLHYRAVAVEDGSDLVWFWIVRANGVASYFGDNRNMTRHRFAPAAGAELGCSAAVGNGGNSMLLGDSTRDAIDTCALRFDGWGFVERRGDEQILVTLSDRFVATLRTSPDQNENHAAFFALQRFLGKWGGDQLPESAREHLAFRLLFLHLYQTEVELSLRHDEWWERWQSRYAERAELYAAEVRESLIRHGRGGRRRAKPSKD